MRDRLEVRREILPYRVSVPVGMGMMDFEFHYNSQEDRYTVSLYAGEVLLCAGEPLVYGRAIFADSYETERYPVVKLVPLDEAERTDEVGAESFGKHVFLTVEDE